MSDVPVLYAVTDPVTALAFLRGQLGFLRENGFEVHLACERTPEIEAFAQVEGVIAHDVRLSRRWWSWQDTRSLSKAVGVLRSVRPVVLNYSTPKAALVWSIASWFSRPDLVVYLLRGLRVEGQRPWRAGFALLWAMEFIASRTADVTVCVSRGLRDRARTLHLVRENRSIILGAGSSNGVDCNRFTQISSDERETARIARRLTESDFVVGYVGRLAKDKGIEDLLDAIELVSQQTGLKCLLVGSSEPNFDLSRALSSRSRAAKVTSWLPATSAVQDEYATFDVFVLPSHREGMSNALLEAQARGLPCITTDATGCADAIEPGISGWVVKVGDVDGLASAISRVSEAEDRGVGMGRMGRARVEDLFNPQALWEQYARLYRAGISRRATTNVVQER
ncbi:MAG: Capsular polysaccharide biosynthesis glycosyl transferase [Marmoricola sp.]|jgi:glycosyltransferase involved in cell wall biosynthesis|nr:Capsular polysaccharide biosynthesis glycosyl transferase [Marmoricola sp.]